MEIAKVIRGLVLNRGETICWSVLTLGRILFVQLRAHLVKGPNFLSEPLVGGSLSEIDFTK